MTLDWIGGHILFTETTGYQIEAAGVRGGGEEEEGVLNLIVGSLVSAYLEGSVVSPNQPRDVLFDETSRLVTHPFLVPFFHSFPHLSRSVIWQEERKEIFKTVIGSLRDSLSPLLAESEDRTIDFLTFDPSIGYIYWWNRKANKIEGLNINNNDVITFVSGVSNVTGEKKITHKSMIFLLFISMILYFFFLFSLFLFFLLLLHFCKAKSI